MYLLQILKELVSQFMRNLFVIQSFNLIKKYLHKSIDKFVLNLILLVLTSAGIE